MRNIIFLFALAVSFIYKPDYQPLVPRGYYFSSAGNDITGSGTQASPYKTLSKASTISMSAGDTIRLHAGETFYGTLTLSVSGTSSTTKIIVDSYGVGADAIISGMTAVSGWASAGTNLWKATVTNGLDTMPNTVTHNGQILECGRYPNSDATNGGYIKMTSFATGTWTAGTSKTVTASVTDLPTAVWNSRGAEVVIRTQSWVIGRADITNDVGQTITFICPANVATPTSGNGFFIQNDLDALDKNYEWFYNPVTHEITVYLSGGVAPTGIEVSTVDNLITSSTQSWLQIDGIQCIGAHNDGIQLTGGASNTVQNCNVERIGHFGIYLDGDDARINYNTELWIQTTGIQAGGGGGGVSSFSNIWRNRMQYIARFPGLGDQTGFRGIGIAAWGNDQNIDSNEIYGVGCTAIYRYKYNNVHIFRNIIDSFNLVKEDDGGIYSITNGSAPNTGGEVYENLIMHGIGNSNGTTSTGTARNKGEAIYFDWECGNEFIHDNHIAFCRRAVFFNHGVINMNVRHNYVYGCDTAFQINSTTTSSESANNIYRKNVVISGTGLNTGRRVGYIHIANAVETNLAGVAAFDSNTYVINTAYTTPFQIENTAKANYDFPGWTGVATFLPDAHTTLIPISGSPTVKFLYNATFAPVAMDLEGYSWTDAEGNSYDVSATLDPLNTVFLIRGAADATPPAPTLKIRSKKIENVTP